MEHSDPSNQLAAVLALLPPAGSVGIADPELAPDRDEVVLGVGVDPAAAGDLIARATAAGAAAVVLAGHRSGATGPESPGQPVTGVPVIDKPAGLSWRRLHQALLAQLTPPHLQPDDELADLAQTIAALTGGLVTIEDTSARVLAYSRSSDEVDELRRLSILGRSGPPDYLALLRQWGVYDRLAASEEVVEIAEHPASGVRRRLAVGVFAGRRQLGTIWVQQGNADFGPNAAQALLGAARLAAAQLVNRGPRRPGSEPAGRLADLLGGRVGPDRLGLGRDAARACAVAVVVDDAGADQAEQSVRLGELTAIVTVHAAAFRRRALVAAIAGRVYLLLPALDLPGEDAPAAAEAMLAAAVTAARDRLGSQTPTPGQPIRAALGSVVASVAEAARSAAEADRSLTVPGTAPVLRYSHARNRLITQRIENAVDQDGELHDPRIARLVARDRPGASTLLRYLDTGSDVSRVAAELDIHPTTVRYRLRRLAQALELDLTDADDRLSVQVQLRCELHRGA